MTTTVRSARQRVSLATAIVLLAVAACGDSGGTTGPPAGEDGGVSVAVASSQVTVVQGGSVTLGVTISRTGSFTGAVSVSAQGLPAGVTTQSINVPAGETAGVLTLTASSAAATGSSAVTVQASGSGVVSASAALQLTVAAPPSFTIALEADAVSLAAPGTATVDVEVERSGGFEGPINLAVTLDRSQAERGLTVEVEPSPITGSEATIEIAADESVSPGSYDFAIEATAEGVPAQTSQLRLTVEGDGSQASFSLSVSPATLQITAGGQGTAQVSIEREDGFTGAVSLSGESGGGVTLSFDPANVTGSTSTLSVQTTPESAGSHTVTITGTADGVEAQQTTLSLEVTTPSPGGNVTWTFCPLTGIPIWAAYQDGEGPWMRADVIDYRVSFQIDSGRGGITYVYGPLDSGGYVTTVFHGTTAELQTRSGTICGGAEGPGKTVNANFVGVGADQSVYAALGSAATFLSGAQGSGAVTFPNVPNGTIDFFAARIRPDGTSVAADRAIIRRDQNPADGSMLAPVDFGSTEAFEPVQGQATVGGDIAGELIGVISAFRTANDTYGTFYSSPGETGISMLPWWGVPADRTASGDFHQLFVTASTETRVRIAGVVLAQVQDRTVELGPALSNPTVSQTQGSPFMILEATLPLQPEYDDLFGFQVVALGSGHAVTVQATAGWLGSTNPVMLTWGDYSDLAGFDDAWLPSGGAPVSWLVSATDHVVGDDLTDPWVEGTYFRTAMAGGVHSAR